MATTDTDLLLKYSAEGRSSALDALLARHRASLRRMVQVRMDDRMSRRIDPSDVVQEALVQAVRRIEDYLKRRPMPFRLWLQKTALECLLVQHRRHLDAQVRSLSREVRFPDNSSAILATALVGCGRTPSDPVANSELADQVRAALNDLSDPDHEIVWLRNYERLSNLQTASVLGIGADAARKRYTRALRRLRDNLVKRGPLGIDQ